MDAVVYVITFPVPAGKVPARHAVLFNHRCPAARQTRVYPGGETGDPAADDKNFRNKAPLSSMPSWIIPTGDALPYLSGDEYEIEIGMLLLYNGDMSLTCREKYSGGDTVNENAEN